MSKQEEQFEYTPTCHLVVERAGHVWPDTKENRELGRKTRCVLTEAQAKRHGPDLTKIGPAPQDIAKEAEITHGKQVTATATK